MEQGPPTRRNGPMLRVFIGDAPASGVAVETIVELHTNLDDLNPQVYETVFERLLPPGLWMRHWRPDHAKKGRPGTVLSVLAPREQVEAVLAVLFSDTTALGVRTQDVQRRAAATLCVGPGSRGDVRIKVADHQPGRSKGGSGV